MPGQPNRVEELKADLAAMRIHDPSAPSDQRTQRLGGAAMLVGVALSVIAYAISHGTTDPLAQRDAIVLALVGVACAITGGALYLHGAMAGFLRFWLVRDLHERRAQTDRIVDHLHPGDRPVESELN